MRKTTSTTAFIIFLIALCTRPVLAEGPEEVWIPKSSGGFHIIQNDTPVRVQYELNEEVIDITGQITNLGKDKKFKGSYLRVATENETRIVMLKDIRFLETIEGEDQGDKPAAPKREPSRKSAPNLEESKNDGETQKRSTKAFAVKVGGEIGTTPQGRPWFLGIVFETAKSQNIDTVIIEFDTPGGILDDGFSITSQILDARESGITVIGWVKDALSAGARPALACNQLFVHPNARLGGAEWYRHGVEYDVREITHNENIYLYPIPKNVIYHRSNDYLPDRIRAKIDSYTEAIDRRLTQRSNIPPALLDSMCVMESELWHNPQNNTLSNAQRESNNVLIDDSNSVLTLNADQLIQFLNAKPASSMDEIAQSLKVSTLDGTGLPYRSTERASEIKRLKANLKKSADLRVLVEDIRDKLADMVEGSPRLVELSKEEREREDKQRARKLEDYEAYISSRGGDVFKKPPPPDAIPLKGPPALTPDGRKSSGELRKKLSQCFDMANKNYDLLEDQIKTMLNVNSVTEFVESKRVVLKELKATPRTIVEFTEFLDVLDDEVLEIFFTRK